MLDLAVEATFPVCEAMTVALISVSASIQGVVIMELKNYLAGPIIKGESVTLDSLPLSPVNRS